MESRLAGIVATLWFFFVLLSVFIALVFSPMGLRLLLPDVHPVTWIYPVFITLPPVLLGLGRLVDPRKARVLLWPIAAALVVFALLLFAYLAANFVGY